MFSLGQSGRVNLLVDDNGISLRIERMFRANKRPAGAFFNLRAKCVKEGLPIHEEWRSAKGEDSATKRFVQWISAELARKGLQDSVGYVQAPGYILCTPELIDRKRGLVPDNISFKPGAAPYARLKKGAVARKDITQVDVARRMRVFCASVANLHVSRHSMHRAHKRANHNNHNSNNNNSNSNNADTHAEDDDSDWVSEGQDIEHIDDDEDDDDDDEYDDADNISEYPQKQRTETRVAVPRRVDASVMIELCEIDCAMTPIVTKQAEDMLATKRSPTPPAFNHMSPMQRDRIKHLYDMLTSTAVDT